MNIVYTTNDAFVPQVATGMCSVYDNNKCVDEVHIYIISDRIAEDNKEKLRGFASAYGRQVHIIELGEIKSYFDFEFDTKGWNPVVLARLVLEQLLPDDVERIIYLDGDTVVLDDLSELWDTDMGQCVVGACPEPTVDKKRKSSLGLERETYCNAGVLLINFKKWREDNTGRRIIKYYEDHNGQLFANDQDAINGALKGELYILSPRYNYFNIYSYYPYKMLKKLMEPAVFISESEYAKAIKTPAIVHYLGEERPWREGNRHEYRSRYEQYLSMTPWKEAPKEQGWMTYFLCLGILNTVTRPFPIIRYKIINALIPSFMKLRARRLKKK